MSLDLRVVGLSLMFSCGGGGWSYLSFVLFGVLRWDVVDLRFRGVLGWRNVRCL